MTKILPELSGLDEHQLLDLLSRSIDSAEDSRTRRQKYGGPDNRGYDYNYMYRIVQEGAMAQVLLDELKDRGVELDDLNIAEVSFGIMDKKPKAFFEKNKTGSRRQKMNTYMEETWGGKDLLNRAKKFFER